MRIWHKDLIPYLPRQQLLGQWRECCLIAKQIAEKGTPNHVLVNRVLEYSMLEFFAYGKMICREIIARGYKADFNRFAQYFELLYWFLPIENPKEKIFKDWHNDRYLRQCLANLQEKYDCGAIPEDEWKRITDKWHEWK